jgi:glycosyltransferase involved in cell wall biosynthesis
MELAVSLGIKDRVLVLGLLPKPHQIALMRDSVAVLQPTLCEGGPGGGATYNAVSLGVPVILSNIPINCEISEERETSFFQAQDPASLATAMTSALDCPLNRDQPEALLARGTIRWERYSTALRDVIYRTVARRMAE